MEKKKEWSIGRSELSVSSWNSEQCQMTGLFGFYRAAWNAVAV